MRGNYMKHIYNSKQMYQIEETAMQQFFIPSMVLMERAALKVVEEIYHLHLENRKIIVLCGTGNNGADGIAVARMLAERKRDVAVFLIGDYTKCTEENKRQLKMLDAYKVQKLMELPQEDENIVYVDALFGIGCSRPIDGLAFQVIREINKRKGYKIAIDIPSGIDSFGHVQSVAFQADTTVTFSYQKVAQALYPGHSYAGNICIADIGINEQMTDPQEGYFGIEDADLKSKVPVRAKDGNKGTFGKLLVIAGSFGMAGAAYFSAKAAYLCGAGMVKIMSPEANRIFLQEKLPEAILSVYDGTWEEAKVLEDLQWADAILIGPGLGKEESMAELLQFVLTNAAVPVVCDADGLNLLADNISMLLQPHTDFILTPHLGEMSRLRKESISYIKEHLIETAEEFARDYQVIMALKDAVSVCAIPYERTYLNLSGNDGMATAGSGDVLAGIIAGLIVTGMKPSEAAPYGMYLHGRAGDAAFLRKSAYSLMASDILDGISEVFSEIQS